MEQVSLFETKVSQPLAARVRPRTLEEFVGQTHLLGEGKVLRRLIESDNLSSMIFWGPPGVGKTTLARIIAGMTKAEFIDFSAVTSGIKEIRTVMPSSSAICRIRLMRSRTPCGSMPSVGSSMMTTLGSFISTSATPRRCLMPRE